MAKERKRKKGGKNDAQISSAETSCECTVRTIHCSRAEQRASERGRGEAGETGICCCWFQKHGWSENRGVESGSWIPPLLSRTDGELWERMGERQRKATEQEIVRGLLLLFFFYMALSRLFHYLGAIPLFCMTPNIFSLPHSLYYCMFATIRQLLPCPYLQCRCG